MTKLGFGLVILKKWVAGKNMERAARGTVRALHNWVALDGLII